MEGTTAGKSFPFRSGGTSVLFFVATFPVKRAAVAWMYPRYAALRQPSARMRTYFRALNRKRLDSPGVLQVSVRLRSLCSPL